MSLNTKDGFSFGVEDSVELGSGNAQLLNDLFAEDAGDDGSGVAPITEDVIPAGAPAEKVKTKSVKGEDGNEPIIETVSGQELIDSFLGSDEEEEEEEEEEVITKKDTIVKDEDGGDGKSEDSIYSSFAKDLFKIGAFSKGEDEDDVEISTPEAFLERLELEKKRGANEMLSNFISKFGEDYQNAFDAIFVKGVNPQEYYSSFNQIADYASLDMSKEDNQVQVIKRMLSDQGFDPEDIDSEVERLKNYGDLESTSTKYHKAIVKQETSKLENLKEQKQKDLQMKAQIKEQYIQNVQSTIQEKLKTKEFDGIPLSGNMAKELNDFLLVDKFKNANGDLLTDFDVALMQLKKPENHEMKIKVGLLLKTLEKDPTLSTIQKSGITKKTDGLFTEVTRLGKKQNTKSSSSQGNHRLNPWEL